MSTTWRDTGLLRYTSSSPHMCLNPPQNLTELRPRAVICRLSFLPSLRASGRLDCLTPLVCGSHLAVLEAMSERPAGTHRAETHHRLPLRMSRLTLVNRYFLSDAIHFTVLQHVCRADGWNCAQVRTTHRSIALRVAGDNHPGDMTTLACVVAGRVERSERLCVCGSGGGGGEEGGLMF